ncbi:MAG: hypothetical protein O7C67_08585 [Gammaproteobacteria bacterium]|nr:hypothetical protein [Gammaproteobacteria bacterium]
MSSPAFCTTLKSFNPSGGEHGHGGPVWRQLDDTEQLMLLVLMNNAQRLRQLLDIVAFGGFDQGPGPVAEPRKEAASGQGP